MQVSVCITDISESERMGLQFAMDRFNAVNGRNVVSFDEFVAAFVGMRLVPQFVAEEQNTFKRGVQRQLRSVTLTGGTREVVQNALNEIAPALDEIAAPE